MVQFSSVQSLSCIWLFATPWTTAHQASLSITNSQSWLKPMSIELMMPSNHLILCRPLLLLPSIFPSIRVFSNESALCVRHLKPQEKTSFMVRGPERRGPGESDSVREVQRGSSTESVGICTSSLLSQSCEYTEQTQRRRERLGRLTWDRKYYPLKAKRNFPSQPNQAIAC